MLTEKKFTRREKSLRRLGGLRRRNICSLCAAGLALTALTLLATPSAHAQVTAQFTASQIRVPTSSLSYPYRVAVDAAGNVYISDTVNNRVLKETPSTNGGYTETVVAASGLLSPFGVAVDSQGNVYIADDGNNRVLQEAPSGNAYAQTVVGTSALSSPTGLAVDSSDNLYIADTAHGRAVREVPDGSSFDETVIATGLSDVVGIAVDSSGNVFLSDIGTDQVFKETPSSGTYTQSTVATTGLNQPYDVAVDANDNLYIADFDNQRIVKETFIADAYSQTVYPTFALSGFLGLALDAAGDIYIADTYGQTIWKSSPAGGNFGPVNVKTPSSAGYLLFSFTGSGTLSVNRDVVVTQGAAGLVPSDFDYSDPETGSCGTAAIYNPGDSCSISVQFTPQAPGQRLGAGQILDSSNNILATGYLTGTGIGPETNFLPGSESVLDVTCDLDPQGVAVDASGNVYFADYGHDLVQMISPSGVITTIADASSGMGAPETVAVDGAGNIYIGDSGNSQILKVSPVGGSYTFDIIANSGFNGLNSSGGVAVDANGNVYIADTNNNRILMETPLNGTYVQSVIPTSGLALPFSVAVDLAGDLYIADLTNNQVVKLTLLAGVYHQSVIAAGFSEPTAAFVDANGNVYVADYGHNRVVKETLSSGTYTESIVTTSNLTNPYGVALDGNGNIYITDVGGNRVIKENVVDPPSLTFASSNVGSNSSDSPRSVTMLNFGNASLAVPLSSAGPNPMFSTASFTLDGSTTCPEVALAGPPSSLAANTLCAYAIDFSPTTTGAITDALVLIDDDLGELGASQTISVSGTGLSAAPPTATVLTFTAAPVSTAPFGQSVTLTASLLPFASGGQSTNGELVTFKNGTTVLGSGMLTAGAASLTLTTLPAGVDSLTATFAGDLNFAASTSTALSYTVTRITPVITWATPAQIIFGTALSGTQLNATSLVAGTFVYTPASGTIPAGGMDTLSVTLNPTDAVTYTPATTTVVLAVYDIGISVSGDASTQSVSAGAAAAFPFTAAPQGATTFVNPVTFSVTGLPPGATATFTPATILLGSPSTPVNMIVQTASATAFVVQKSLRIEPLGATPIVFTLLFLPILGLQALRRRSRLATSTRAAVLLATVVVGAAAILGGCAGTTSSRGTSYPLVVTATSGTLHTSFAMTLIVNK